MRWPMPLASLAKRSRRAASHFPRLVWLPSPCGPWLGGCIQSSLPPSGVGPRRSNRGHVPCHAAFSLEGGTFSGAKLRLTQGNLTRELLLEVTDGEVIGHVDNLPVGDWNVTLDIYDQDGDITHRASAVVRIRPDETTTLRLQAEPNEGMLEIEADISAFSKPSEVNGPGSTSTTTKRPPFTLTSSTRCCSAAQSAPAGRLRLSDRAVRGDPIRPGSLYRSPWESVRIYPGKTVKVRWQARSGAAHIEMGLSQMPPPSFGTALGNHGETGGRLTWLPAADPSVSGYRIYLKHDEYRRLFAGGGGASSERAWETRPKTSKMAPGRR